MQLNCKLIKKWQPPPPPFLYQPLFQGYPYILPKFLVPPQVTQFLESPTPLPLMKRLGSNNDNRIIT